MELGSVSAGLRSLFFMLTPNESSFQKMEDVPQYVQQATPFFIGLMVLELVVGVLKTGAPVVTISDGLTSISAGMISRLPLLFTRGCELTAYMYVWDQYRLVELPWDSAWTWWFTFLGVDFCYYWVHRFAHELAILWAAHQVHHSSEYYNLTTALRQSLTQQFTSWPSIHSAGGAGQKPHEQSHLLNEIMCLLIVMFSRPQNVMNPRTARASFTFSKFRQPTCNTSLPRILCIIATKAFQTEKDNTAPPKHTLVLLAKLYQKSSWHFQLAKNTLVDTST